MRTEKHEGLCFLRVRNMSAAAELHGAEGAVLIELKRNEKEEGKAT